MYKLIHQVIQNPVQNHTPQIPERDSLNLLMERFQATGNNFMRLTARFSLIINLDFYI